MDPANSIGQFNAKALENEKPQQEKKGIPNRPYQNRDLMCAASARGDLKFERYLCLGVDAGGSRISAVLTDICGTLLVSPMFGKTANPHLVQFVETSCNVAEVITALWSGYRKLPSSEVNPVLSIAVALSGGDSTDICNNYCETLRVQLDNSEEILPQSFKLTVVHDSLAPIALLLPKQMSAPCKGISTMNNGSEECTFACVIAGTGSVAVLARHSSDGCLHIAQRRGGWGEILSDEGSAYHMTTGVIRACLRRHDVSFCEGSSARIIESHQEANNVLSACYEHFDVKTKRVADLVETINAPCTSKAKIAGFAKIIGALAKGGNQLCHDALRNAGRQLGSLLADLLEPSEASTQVERTRVKSAEALQVCLVGGMFFSWNVGVELGFKESMKPFRHQIKLYVLQTAEGAATGSARLAALEHYRSWSHPDLCPRQCKEAQALDTSMRPIFFPEWNNDLSEIASFISGN